ncbi:MAG TPA: hydantoinase/oxoprolinase family protein, partial [Gemmatimonadaceae bacterium]|nr:hydantoinase/oxoprolinase family protein [Gemmatimonadaceae bacterium]
GGTEPTVTDAHIVLGTIHEDRLSGGIRIDPAAAHRALEPLAARLGVEIRRLASGIIATSDATMARALRRVSIERGIDPRGCTLVAFGGGGPLHACGLAERIGAERILVPPHAGVLSALGLAVAAERREGMISVMATADSMTRAEFDEMVRRLEASVAASIVGRAESRVRARYVGQGHELDVPIHSGDDAGAVRARFVEQHQARMGFSLDGAVEFVSARRVVSGDSRSVAFGRRGASRWRSDDRVDDGGCLEMTIDGPASFALADATVFVAPGWRATPLAIGGWAIQRMGRESRSE